jgi:hypothetical protein
MVRSGDVSDRVLVPWRRHDIPMLESVMAVIRDKQGNVIWNRDELPRDLESLSTGTHVLSSSRAIDWMLRVPTITAVLFEKHLAASPSVDLAALDWLYQRDSDRRTNRAQRSACASREVLQISARNPCGRSRYQAGPDKALDDLSFDHHESKRPHSLEAVLACFTSIGW